jgi:hypothetical protein
MTGTINISEGGFVANMFLRKDQKNIGDKPEFRHIEIVNKDVRTGFEELSALVESYQMKIEEESETLEFRSAL